MGSSDWRHEAACLDHDPDLFFPSGSTGPAWLELQRAKDICRGCPVRQPCLHWAIANGQQSGVWGGLSEGERRWQGQRISPTSVHDSPR